ncbi:MAG: SAM-dependent methyltransferase [Acetobacteraceae bacterium]|nr:SAM-dependent methyltransferase [Acetobacteraceae bacterium]
MARANAAFYARADPLAGFATAPEISQVFGELLGAWAAVAWQAMGAPADAILAEAGPGRGTLMADALRVLRRAAPALAARVHLVETSPTLRARQAAVLPDAAWHARLDELPAGPLVLLANEFLDALPIRQCVRRGGGWMERHVADGEFVELPCPPPPTVDAGDGAVVEWSPAGRAAVQGLAARIASRGGVALLVDYGPEHSAPGDSLQALRDGKPADPLADPGEADLTAHVDFAALAGVARAAGAAVQGPVPQGVFLTRLGLFQRSGALARTQPPARAGALMQAASRLAEPHQMGRLFKAMAVCHPGLPPLPGFAA